MMNPSRNIRGARARLFVWWVLWAAILGSFLLVYGVLGRVPARGGGAPTAVLGGSLLLFFSVLIRWLLLPRLEEPGPALPFFILGLASAEACGYLGIFLGGFFKEELVVGSVLGMVQFVPVFAGRYYQSVRPEQAWRSPPG
jgi:hypothetical protein